MQETAPCLEERSWTGSLARSNALKRSRSKYKSVKRFSRSPRGPTIGRLLLLGALAAQGLLRRRVQLHSRDGDEHILEPVTSACAQKASRVISESASERPFTSPLPFSPALALSSRGCIVLASASFFSRTRLRRAAMPLPCPILWDILRVVPPPPKERTSKP